MMFTYLYTHIPRYFFTNYSGSFTKVVTGTMMMMMMMMTKTKIEKKKKDTYACQRVGLAILSSDASQLPFHALSCSFDLLRASVPFIVYAKFDASSVLTEFTDSAS